MYTLYIKCTWLIILIHFTDVQYVVPTQPRWLHLHPYSDYRKFCEFNDTCQTKLQCPVLG